ncbi:hypothetical protein CATMIT_01841, partial [Catenibacterium mitsuokai DSM 15897]
QVEFAAPGASLAFGVGHWLRALVQGDDAALVVVPGQFRPEIS